MQMIVPSTMGLLLVFHIEVGDCHLAKTQGPGNLWHLECAGFQQTSELLRRHRSTEVVSLDLVTIVRLEKAQFPNVFYALRNNPHFETAPHADHGSYNSRFVGCESELVNEGLIDLKRVDGEFSEIAQTGIARAEIIDGEFHSSCTQ